MKSESTGMGTAYFSDGHTEVITDFEISKDYKDVWFTVESGRWFVYKEELVYRERPLLVGNVTSMSYYPEYKFFKAWVNRDRDEFGATCDVEYLVTDEIERIRVCVAE